MASNAAFSTAMFSVLSNETSTFADIAAFHSLPATSIQPPYANMPWDLYAKNFKRTLTRLQLYHRSADRQNPTVNLRLLSSSDPLSSHLSPIAVWLDTGALPPNPRNLLRPYGAGALTHIPPPQLSAPSSSQPP
jgi:hypothetical protein